MNSTLKYYFNAIIASYAEVLFLQNAKYGIVLLLISFLNVNVAISGLVAIIVALAFAYFIRMEAAFLENGFYIYNPLLVGMSIGYLFQITLISFILIVMASIFTFLLTMVLYKLLAKASVPILSLPFTIVSTIIYLATLNYTSLYTQALYTKPFIIDLSFMPMYLSSYFKALGTILFLPYISVGIAFALILLSYSRIMFIFSIIGFYFGVYIHSLMLGSMSSAMLNPYTFNYILISIALGAVFLVPSLRSLVVSLLGVSMSILLIDASLSFWTIYKIPVFTLPFNIITISFLFVLQSVKLKEFAYIIRKTPEMTLRSYILSIFRFKSDSIKIFLPFSGKWTVYQAFNDEWTHKGEWKYAYDFVIMKDGKSFSNTGNDLQDYYAFSKPVLSPVYGYVVDLKDHIEDNKIGEVNNIENWGNYIIIKTAEGNYVEISHFAKKSLKVKNGEYIEAGQFLGLCGNSGYSPQPHIHIQVQESILLGSKTIPFYFINYIEQNHVHFYENPVKHSEIESYFSDKSLDKKLSFTLDNEYKYEVYMDEKHIDDLHIKVKMNRFSGKFYFEDKQGNILYFFKEAGMFYFYDYEGQEKSWLQKMYISMPRVPLIYKNGLTWCDYLPKRYTQNDFISKIVSIGAMMFPKAYITKGEWKFEDERNIKGVLFNNFKQIVSVNLDQNNGINTIKIDNLIIRKIK